MTGKSVTLLRTDVGVTNREHGVGRLFSFCDPKPVELNVVHFPAYNPEFVAQEGIGDHYNISIVDSKCQTFPVLGQPN